METIDIIIIILVVITIVAVTSCCCCYKKENIKGFFRRCSCNTQPIGLLGIPVQTKNDKSKNTKDVNSKESFISSGSEGASVNGNSIIGPHMYATQIIDNNKTFEDMINTANKEKIASDGHGTLGAGKGVGFDKELKNQQNYRAYMSKKGKISNEEMNKISKSINEGLSNSLGNISLFNRGKQVAGKLIIQDGLNSTVAMMDEKYYSERQKNRNIYTTTKVIHAKGFDVNPENIGRELSDFKPSKMLSRHNTRIPYVTEAARPNNGVSVENGKLKLESNKATVSTDVGRKHISDGSVHANLDNGKQMIGMKSTQ